MITLTILFIAINILLAKIDSKKILAGKTINHFNNGLYYGLMCLGAIPIAGILGTFFGLSFFTVIEIIQLMVSLLLIRKIVFDIGLNLFRGLKWNYISLTTTSKIDQLENKVFKNNGSIKYGIYILLLITNIIIFM